MVLKRANSFQLELFLPALAAYARVKIMVPERNDKVTSVIIYTKIASRADTDASA